MKKKQKERLGLISLALLFLINPDVTLIDILPDFVAWFIIAKKLTYAADRVPYFAEARDSFAKLALVSILKFPAFLVMNYSRSQNVGDNDISALFTLVFAVVEIILLVFAVRYLFLAFFHLGERSEAVSLITPFPLSKKRARNYTPEALKNLTLAFFGYKCASYCLPELLLLTRGVSAGEYATTFNFARLYPYTIVFIIVSVPVFGAFFMSRMKKYLRAIKREGKFTKSVEALVDEGGREVLAKKLKIKNLRGVITLFSIATVFAIEIRFDNFDNMNLLPSFIFGALLVFALIRLSRQSKGALPAIISGCAFTISALVSYIYQSRFLEEYGYEKLALSKAAKAQYISVIISAAVETALLAIFLILVARALSRFVVTHAGIETASDRYSRTDKDYHRNMQRKIYIIAVFGIVSWITKLADILLKYFAKNISVGLDDGVGVVTESIVPWFSVVVLLFTIFYIGYSLYFYSCLKEEVELKYL